MPRAKPAKFTPQEEALLQKLREREAALKIEKRNLQSKANRRAKKADTYCKVLVGAAVTYEAENNPAYKAALVKLLTRFFTTNPQRAALEILGVPPLPAEPVAAGQPDTAADGSAEFPAVAAQGYGDGVRMVRH